MKILVALTFYHPHWTGLTAYAKRIAEGLVTRGHQVTVLTSRHTPDLPLEEWHNGVRIVRLPTAARISRGVLMPSFPATFARLMAEHDIAHVHTPMLEVALVTGIARALGKPSVVTHQGDLVMPAGLFNQFVQLSVVSAMSLGLRLATRVVVHSADYGRHSRFLAPIADKLSAIYPPAEIPEPDQAAVAAWRHELGLDGKRLVGFAGRFVEEKGFDFLLQSIPLVHEQMPEVHFVYAGETNVVYEPFFERWRPIFEAQRAAITTLGLILDQQRLANFYAMVELFALPSRTDCFPSVQVEALLCGTPLITTDIPGAREVVQVTGMGHLVAPRNPQALADGIVAALRDPAYRRPTRAEVRATFSTERSVGEYERLFAELVGRDVGHADSVDKIRIAQPPPIPSVPLPRRPTPNLSEQDRATLALLLRNEADMAFRRRALTLLDFLDLKDGERVLDCGCGMGVYMMMINRLRNVDVVGVDGDVGRLEWAEREGIRADLSRVDIHSLPFADASFDKVLMSEVLEHVTDDRRALREVYRVLKPGGTLALSVPHANYPFLWDPINKTIEALGMRPIRQPGAITGLWSNHWRLYLPAELRDVAEGAGFTIETLEEQTHYSFPLIHFIVYSIGKPLIEYNLLPKKLRDSADRFRGEQNSGSMLNPINLGVRAFRAADACNDALRGTERTFVNIVLKATKRS